MIYNYNNSNYFNVVYTTYNECKNSLYLQTLTLYNDLDYFSPTNFDAYYQIIIRDYYGVI